MSMSLLEKSPVGKVVSTLAGYETFVPAPLPREVALSQESVYRLDEASRAVAMLAGVGETIPNPHLLIRPFLRREAVLSSKIEGTQASISDVFRYEASGEKRPWSDVAEVTNYVKALERGLELLHELPVCVRLMNQLHADLLTGVRGDEKHPGRLRESQVWIGSEGAPVEEARFVPPPPALVRDLLQDLEEFVNAQVPMPPLVQCALMHYQFEAIHPYLDGNGRIGRLLIILLMCQKNLLRTPLLYLSAYFEKDKAAYYDELLAMSQGGDWERWLAYFLKGVHEQANDALTRVRHIREMLDRDRKGLQAAKESGSTLRLLEEVFAQPFMTAPRASSMLGISNQGARNILDRLADHGIVELQPGTWPRMYVARGLLELIEAPAAAA